MSVIKKANSQSEEGSVIAGFKMSKTKALPQGYSLSDFRSVAAEISIGHSTMVNNPKP